MTQNIYDNGAFFGEYCKLGRSLHGLAGAAEWPALRSLLPELRERVVLDLGCGFGWFCRWAREQGASRVLGIDVSENMLKRARELTSDGGITYEKADLERVTLPSTCFDLAYSSLALHYLENLPRVFAEVHDALVPGGSFIFSNEHPIYTAPRNPGWLIGPDGHRVWPVDSYLVEGIRETDWLAKGVLKYHRTIGTLVNLLIHANFVLSHLEEWVPTDEQIAARPELSEERERPMFLFVAARKVSGRDSGGVSPPGQQTS
jgi:SAM-dependent methyltransferase